MAKKTIPKKVKIEIQKFIETLKNDKLPINKVILFGSFAKGKQNAWSDIDLCVISPKFKNSFDATRYLWMKRKIFNPRYAIEPVGFNTKDFRDGSCLIEEIKKEGMEIKF